MHLSHNLFFSSLPTNPNPKVLLANLNLLDTDMAKSQEKVEPVIPAKPPSADSVHVLLKQSATC